MSVSPVRRIPGAVEPPGAEILSAERASDAERDRYIEYLRGCHVQGRIDATVFQARMHAAAECTTRPQLAALLADLPPLPAPARLRLAAALAPGTPSARRWLYVAGAVLALFWAIIPAVLIFTATGYPVTYRDGSEVWMQTEHPGVPLMFMWMFIITGTVALAADVITWLIWESGGGDR